VPISTTIIRGKNMVTLLMPEEQGLELMNKFISSMARLMKSHIFQKAVQPSLN
jgi:hypothetical protein